MHWEDKHEFSIIVTMAPSIKRLGYLDWNQMHITQYQIYITH